jgi:hypothetical protein
VVILELLPCRPKRLGDSEMQRESYNSVATENDIMRRWITSCSLGKFVESPGAP